MYLFGKQARLLTDSEFSHHLKRAIKQDKESIHALYFHFVPSIVSLCARLRNNSLDYEDRVSCALEGVGIAIRRLKSHAYDSSAQAAEYIHKTATGHLLSAIRRENWRQIYIPRSVDIPIQKGCEVTFRDIIRDERESIEETLIHKDSLAAFLERLHYVLSGREKRIVELTWGLNDKKKMTFEEIAKVLKPPVSKQAVEQMYKRAFRRLKRDPIIREVAK